MREIGVQLLRSSFNKEESTNDLHNHYGAPLPLPLPSTATATAITTTELKMHVSSLKRFFFLFCGQAKSKGFLGLQINRQ